MRPEDGVTETGITLSRHAAYPTVRPAPRCALCILAAFDDTICVRWRAFASCELELGSGLTL